MAIQIDVPQIAYKTWVIEVHTGDKQRDYELEKELSFPEYAYNKEHEHVR